MTKKDYILIASVLQMAQASLNQFKPSRYRDGKQQAICDIVILFGDYLRQENPRFNYAKFVEACSTNKCYAEHVQGAYKGLAVPHYH